MHPAFEAAAGLQGRNTCIRGHLKEQTVLLSSVFAGLVAAQVSSTASAPIPTESLSPCVVQCITQAIDSTDCAGLYDTQCICGNQDFHNTMRQCVRSNCNPPDGQQGLQLQLRLCRGVPGFSTVILTSTESGSSASGTSSVTAPISSPFTTSVTSFSSTPSFSFSSRASSIASGASSVINSLTSRVASATNSPNAAIVFPSFDLVPVGIWTAVIFGGMAVAQLLI
ncbi:CFEM domain protein [Ceratobasidium sp. AG-Ba]|nr:CFEM domain protein [Ceratobasidium sp. AG-Ba]